MSIKSDQNKTMDCQDCADNLDNIILVFGDISSLIGDKFPGLAVVVQDYTDELTRNAQFIRTKD